MIIIFFIVSFFASIAGAICGMGGGVIIKPVLDAAGVMTVSSISFLSGCTVLSMAIISVWKQFYQRQNNIDLALGTPLAIGSAVGGVLGKYLFELVTAGFKNENLVGVLQASVLALVTVGTLVYTLFQARIQTRQIHSKLTAVAIGISLGIISSFLGIGGGPINLVVLDYFLSMKAKKAATNSLYIILFSQAASFLCTILTGRVPEFLPQFLIVMIIGGVLGGIVGSKISRTLTTKKVRELFYIMMSVIVGINTYNVIGFLR